MMALFKYKTTIATYALFSGIVMKLMVVTTCTGECSLPKDEKIIGVRQYPAFISAGNDATIFWGYCKVNFTSITGFIVFREFHSNQAAKMYLLSIDLKGRVYFTRNKDHTLWNRIDLTENDHVVSFSIKNVSTNDSGYYRLEIRREGYGDLYSRVQIIVKPWYNLMNERLATAEFMKRPTIKLTENRTKINRNNNSNTAILYATLVPSALVIVLLSVGILILIMYIKKGKKREGQEKLINETFPLESENSV